MTVKELIEKLRKFDGNLPVTLGADGAYLGEAEGVFLEKNLYHCGSTADRVIIAEWEQRR